MKHKTAELEGALLDAAVAKAVGLRPFLIGSYMESGVTYWREAPPPYSTDWRCGGAIIERERISLDDPDRTRTDQWRATVWGTLLTREQGGNDGASALGTTPLIAAMRAYCASKLGEEVELP